MIVLSGCCCCFIRHERERNIYVCMLLVIFLFFYSWNFISPVASFHWHPQLQFREIYSSVFFSSLTTELAGFIAERVFPQTWLYRPTSDVGKERVPPRKGKREEFNPLKSSAAPAKWIELETQFKRIFDKCVSLGQKYRFFLSSFFHLIFFH